MKRLSLLILIPFLLPATVFRSTAAAAESSGEPVVIGQRLEMRSETLNEDRQLIVATPPGYESNPDERYPVLYLLDGGQHFHHTTGLINFLADNERCPRMLVVAIPNTDRTRDLTPSSKDQEEINLLPTQGGADNFLKFLGDELIPWVEGRYRTRDYRILVGHSFGGLFALHTLITQPDVFDAYIAISPSLQWNDQGLVQRAEAFFESTTELDAAVYMTVGNEGGALLGGVRKLAGILDEKTPKGMRWDFRLMEEESHGSVPHRSTYQGLELIFEGWHLPDVVAAFDAGGMDGIQARFKRVGDRFGIERQAPTGTFQSLVYRLIEADRLEEAARVLAHDPENYPAPGMFLDMLADGYREKGDKDVAIRYYTQSLETNPGGANARKKLSELGVDVDALLPEVVVPAEVLATYAGEYSLDEGRVLAITLEEGSLYSQSTGRKKRLLHPMSQVKFFVAEDDIQITFNADESGAVPDLQIHQFGYTFTVERLE